jgi:hypothetical protein
VEVDVFLFPFIGNVEGGRKGVNFFFGNVFFIMERLGRGRG